MTAIDTITIASPSPTSTSTSTTRDPLSKLRDAIDQAVGSIFYGTLLKTMRESPLKGTIGHGGRGEEVFQNQLDQLFVERAGNARSYDLNDTIFERLAASAVAYDRMRQQHDS